MLKQLRNEMDGIANPEKAKILSRFFKTGKGEYGEGDVFLGIVVPEQRKIARKYKQMPMEDIRELIRSKIHEHRLTALFILIYQYGKGNDKDKIFNFYLDNIKYVNSWDLVDLSAPNIVGDYIVSHPEKKCTIYSLVKSKNLWERRVSVLSTFAFIKRNDFSDALKIAEFLLGDEHDLIHKAVGWMLREVGKRDQKIEEKFLDKFYKIMPRTMLRYAIERFDEKKRKMYMEKD